MSELNLVLHCGANSATRGEVINVETPKATETHFPIPHHTLLERVVGTIESAGMQVIGEAHGLNRMGQEYFGLLQVAHESDVARDYATVLGVRNSHNKSFAAALALGSGVFVCDNLCFSGEVVVGRKHTRFIERDLGQLVAKSFGRLSDIRKDQDDRIACYKEVGVSNSQANDLIIASLDTGVIPSRMIPHVLKEWREPAHPEFKGKNAWSLLNAYTQQFKRQTAATTSRRTQRLQGLIDLAIGVSGDGSNWDAVRNRQKVINATQHGVASFVSA
jgi:hypothetical protein